jgi:hypothetical protein
MADKADDIRQELEKGRHDIADARSALTEKLVVLGDRVQETVDGVKHTFDLHYQVKQRPWLLFGGSLLVGFALGRRGAPGTSADRSNTPSSNAQPQKSIVSEVSNQFKDELSTIKGAAFGAVISTLWAMAKQVLPQPVRQIDSAIAKPDVQPIDSSRQITDRLSPSMTNGHDP